MDKVAKNLEVVSKANFRGWPTLSMQAEGNTQYQRSYGLSEN